MTQLEKIIRQASDETAKKIYNVLQLKDDEEAQCAALSEMSKDELKILIELLNAIMNLKSQGGREEQGE